MIELVILLLFLHFFFFQGWDVQERKEGESEREEKSLTSICCRPDRLEILVGRSRYPCKKRHSIGYKGMRDEVRMRLITFFAIFSLLLHA